MTSLQTIAGGATKATRNCGSISTAGAFHLVRCNSCAQIGSGFLRQKSGGRPLRQYASSPTRSTRSRYRPSRRIGAAADEVMKRALSSPMRRRASACSKRSRNTEALRVHEAHRQPDDRRRRRNEHAASPGLFVEGPARAIGDAGVLPCPSFAAWTSGSLSGDGRANLPGRPSFNGGETCRNM